MFHHLQGSRVIHGGNQHEADKKQSNPWCLLLAGFLHGLFFIPENEGDAFIQKYWLALTRPYDTPESRTLHSH
jgi:hypothetical protein